MDLRDNLRSSLTRHVRVQQQGFFEDAAARDRLAAALPAPVAFGAAQYCGALWLLDWDHRIPSRTLVLRLHAYYTESHYLQGIRAVEAREEEIAREDRFPEFDVPDLHGIPADETYEAEMEVGVPPSRLRLTSDWRRDIEAPAARRAVEIVRKSKEFSELRRSISRRSSGLGDLEAAEWSPPCDTGHPRWAIDVWYLLSFNGVVGEGRAFLVDPEANSIVSTREFQFRSGAR